MSARQLRALWLVVLAIITIPLLPVLLWREPTYHSKTKQNPVDPEVALGLEQEISSATPRTF